MSENIDDRQLKAFEDVLASLAPRPGQIDRDRLMYCAGQRSASHRRWIWPVATFTLGVGTAVLGLASLARPVAQPIERIVYVNAPGPDAAKSDASSEMLHAISKDNRPPIAERDDYLRLRQQALRWGIENLPALPAAPVVHALPMNIDRLLDINPTSTDGPGSRLPSSANPGDRS
jgi:hypothetical protein